MRPTRTLAQIQNEYFQVSTAFGDAVFRLETLQKEVAQMRARMGELSREQALPEPKPELKPEPKEPEAKEAVKEPKTPKSA